MGRNDKKSKKSDALLRAWILTPEHSHPGPRRAFSIDEVVAASIALYDEAGPEGFSLAQLAAVLKLTTNALYRYVASREELEALVRDAALGPPQLGVGQAWEDSVRAWAYALADRYASHPWLANLPVRIPFTPNALAWLESLLVALQSAGLDRNAQLTAAAFLDSHVRACAVAAADQTQAREIVLPENFHALLIGRGLASVAEVVKAGRYVEGNQDSVTMLQFGLESFVLQVKASKRGTPEGG